MTDHQPNDPPSSGPACGNCGAVVEPTAVTCPACGVLLAAYQAVPGSSSQSSASAWGDSSATRPVSGVEAGASSGSSATGPSTVTPGSTYQAPATPAAPSVTPMLPLHRPRSQSPIGDALRSSHAEMASTLHPEWLAESDAPAEELSRMASGDDDLADMASGEDELARMASGGKATLAEQVEAELAGAKVTFDGSDPVIEAPDVSVTRPGEGEAEVVERHPPATPPAVDDPLSPIEAPKAAARAHGQPTAPATQSPPTRSATSTAQEKYRAPAIDWVDSERPRTRAHIDATVGTPPAFPDPADKQLAMTKVALMGCLPFVLLFMVIAWIFQGANGGSTFMGVLFIGGLFYLLLKSAGATSRKTTSMPIDDMFTSKRKR